MTTERLLASRYIHDYERVPRRWISVLVNGGSLVLGALYYVILQSFFFGLSLMLFFVVATTVISICSSLAIQFVNRRDAAKLRDLAKESGFSTIHYTLSVKFQLTENVRVTKWLARISAGISIWGAFGMSMSAPCFVLLSEDNPVNHLLYAFVDCYLAISFAIVVWLSLLALGETRLLRDRILSCFSRKQLTANDECYYEPATQNAKGTTDKYFDQLQSAWAM
ncbi:unnamed protein product [Cylicocyclus nassatus]|uniref:Uncharacterized protein n=1 Tax=Cylicocyclus nassatus TaxID=53992 RepID=A0AA36HD62_CYLNA|nr:unnamed protein product [Cylicocyclus nassatus]